MIPFLFSEIVTKKVTVTVTSRKRHINESFTVNDDSLKGFLFYVPGFIFGKHQEKIDKYWQIRTFKKLADETQS